MKSLHAQNALAQQVPVECFQMAEIENNSMSFRNRPLVDRVGLDNVENLVRLSSSFGQSLKQLVSNVNVLLRDEHSCLQSHLDALCEFCLRSRMLAIPLLAIRTYVQYSARAYDEVRAGIMDESHHFVLRLTREICSKLRCPIGQGATLIFQRR